MLNWSIIHTRPRWEKKVAALLVEKGVETFCPLVKEQHQWSDRVKTIERPLMKSHLFVRIDEAQRTTVRLTEGVINFVYRNGKPVVVKDKVIQSIRQFQQLHTDTRAIEAPCAAEKTATAAGLDGAVTNGATLYIKTLGMVLVANNRQTTLHTASHKS